MNFHDAFWYSTIEIEPGVFTPGLNIPTVQLPRRALSRMNLSGLNCLDVGCVEGVLPTLMERQGAKSVTAYDRVDWASKIKLVKDTYDVSFDYIAGMNYFEFSKHAKNLPVFPFDLVMFSGVLYHMLDPVGGLLRTRSLVRDGGIAIIETSALMLREVSVYFNDNGKLINPPNLCVPTLAWLDFILRFCRLRPIDLSFTARGGAAHPDHIRACIVCRAETKPLVYKSGEWDSHISADYSDYLNWNDTKNNLLPVSYETNCNHITRDDGTIDLYATASLFKPSIYSENETALRLSDRV